MKKWPTPNRMTLRTKGAEKNANNLGTFLQNIPIDYNDMGIVSANKLE